MKIDDAIEKICPIFLSAVTIAKMCDSEKVTAEDSLRDDNCNYDNGIYSLIHVYEKNNKRIVGYTPTCQTGTCALWVWDDEEHEEGHCGLIHK